MSKEQILEAIKGMSVLELNDLVKAIEEEFGVTAAAPVAVAGGATGDAAPAQQTEFDVILTASGARKINVIKLVNEIVASVSLKEAKELVDNCPKPLKEKVSKEEAETIKAKFVEIGASVEIK